MRIIHLISGGDVGGAKTHVLSLLEGLGKNNHVQLVCFLEGAFAREARQRGIRTQVFPGNNLPKLCKQVAGMMEGQNYDIIHCHGVKGNTIGLMLRNRMKLPVVSTVHSDPRMDYLGRPLANLVYGTLNKVALRMMDYWIPVSKMTRDMLMERGFDGWRVFQLFNGLDFSIGENIQTRADFLRPFGLDWDEKQVIFGIAARLSPVKDISTLIRAFSAVARRLPNAKLLIAGDGEQRKELETLASGLCPAGSWYFTGWLQNTDPFYKAIDVNMLTSVSEALPYAILEGARMSCATIATRVGGVPQIVLDQQTGFLITPGDVETLAQRMEQMASDSQLRQLLGKRLQEKTKHEYSVEVMTQTMEDIYTTILRREKRKSRSRDGVVICGAYGNGNMGDETILEAILQQLRKHDQDLPVCVISKKPRQTVKRLPVSSVYTFNLWKTARKMRKSRLYISGGGSLIQDATSTRSLMFYLHNIQMAKKNGCKVMMYGCGIGPVTGKRNRRLAGRIINACVDLVSLRDPEARDELVSLGVDKPRVLVTADPALLQNVTEAQQQQYREIAEAAGICAGQRYCLFSLRPWASAETLVPVFAHMAEYIYKTYGLIPVFFQLEPGRDAPITKKVGELVQCPKVMLPPIGDGAVICALMRDMELVVSMRLHALIFAAGQGTTVAAISYDPKVQGFMKYLGSDNWIMLDDVSEEKLRLLADGVFRNGKMGREQLERLRSLATQNDILAWDLINDCPAGEA